MTKQEIVREVVDDIKKDIAIRMSSILRSASFLHKSQGTMTKEYQAFVVGLLHAKAILDDVDPQGNGRINLALARKVRRMRKTLGM